MIILPKEFHNRGLEFVSLKHPRTGEPARFLLDRSSHTVLELTRVGTSTRSGLIEDQLYSDASVIVATPLHPLFLILPVLFDHQKRALPLDVLLGLAADDNTDSLDEAFVEDHLPSICHGTQLDLRRLKGWLDVCVRRLISSVPQLVKGEVLQTIMPLDPNERPSQEVITAAETYAAASMLATSWLSPATAEWYLDSCDFRILENEIKRLESEQVAFAGAAPTLPAKRADTVKAQPAKRAKTVQVKNNTSILDMFKKARPAKSA